MPAIKEALAKMSTAEKLQVMEFLWSALSSHFQVESPAWHDAILDERAHATEDEFEDWEDVKRELRVSAYAVLDNRADPANNQSRLDAAGDLNP